LKDLHLHLSSSTPINVLWELVVDSGYKMPAKTYWEFKHSVTLNNKAGMSLESYLEVLHSIDKAQSYPMAIEKCVYHSFVSAYMSGCSYLELRMNPTKRSQNGAIDLDSIIVRARAGMERAKSVYKIEGGLILCMGRDCTPDANEAVFRKAMQYAGKGIKGIDIAGPYSTNWWNGDIGKRYVQMYKEARDRGLITTVHAGEEKHIKVENELDWVLDDLKPNRIGHGIQIHNYSMLMSKAAYTETIFEVCPTSNITTGVVKNWKEMSKILNTMNRAGLFISTCTDSTSLINTNIKKEYQISEILNGEWKDEKDSFIRSLNVGDL
jgi:adenosine deaminase